MQALKEATAQKHKEAERMPFNLRMFGGEMSEYDYLQYLVQQLSIFEAIEQKKLPSKTLNRVPAIVADIEELVAKGFQTEPTLAATTKYSEYLSSLDDTEILPHIYLNYLAIMYGGQMMKSKVPSNGKMYDFEDMQEDMQAIRAVQKDQWADEVNLAYDYIIDIFDELESMTKTEAS